MARVVVDVMLKPEILDPQGQAVQGALGRLGLSGVTDVRQGKQFASRSTVTRGRPVRAHAPARRGAAGNTVIEDYEMRVEQ